MAATLRDLRPVYVVGIGLHRYQQASETPYVVLGLTAVREALADARVRWPDVESVYTGSALLGMAPTRVMLRHLGATGIPMCQVENASASGSTAFRLACLDVAGGSSDLVLALGIDKPAVPVLAPRKTGIRGLADDKIVPATHFALLANRYMALHGVSAAQIGAVAVKNHRNGAANPYAQRQKVRSLEEVMAPPAISGSLTRLQCCPIGEGAAAVLVASEKAIADLGIDRSRAVQVLASVLRTERVYRDSPLSREDAAGGLASDRRRVEPWRDSVKNFDAELTRETAELAYAEAGIGPDDLDVIELHDAFTIEELLYLEAMGVCEPGRAASSLEAGELSIGGRVAVSASGGLLAMGHPIGPTGAGQVVETARQLRGEAGPRQHPGARIGLCHMVGVGAVCAVHVLERS
jgi:acetyl-CoA acetyltransferase